MALRSLSSDTEIKKLSAKVAHARQNLTLSFMVYVTTQPKSSVSLQSYEAELVHEVESAAKSTKSFRDAFDQLTNAFTDLRVGIQRAEKDFESVSYTQAVVLARLSKKLNTSLKAHNSSLSLISDHVEETLKLMALEVYPRRRILDSLYFPQINYRRDNVERAHGQTYKWIFRHKENEDIVWDDFISWLQDTQGLSIYWVRGKPGSGKSTLMRELDENIGKNRHLEGWLSNADFTIASCFFWYAGTANQKSLSGMLLSLLHQLFSQHGYLIDRSISAAKWESALLPEGKIPSWDSGELEKALRTFISEVHQDTKILLLIDGLDEYDGTDEQRHRILELLEDLTRLGSVKVCQSSRPWVIFKDAFRCYPQLRLEELTKGDISQYVQDKLQGNELFQRHQRRYPDLLSNIADEITHKADGVFLWVRLVVRDISKAVRDGCRAKDLIRELRSIPQDLDEYFMRMMNMIDKSYRQDASMIMQTALCNLDFVATEDDNIGSLTSGPDVLLLHLHYLDEDDGPYFAGDPLFYPFDSSHDGGDDIKFFLDNLDRRLTSRCMGLLEAGKPPLVTAPWQAKVEFLHRTVRDFLCTASAQKILFEYTDGPFDAHSFRLNVLAAHIWSLADSPTPYSCAELVLPVSCLCTHIQKRPDEQVISYLLYESMIQALRKCFLNSKWMFKKTSTKMVRFLTEAEALWPTHASIAPAFAIELGWRSYVKMKVTGDQVKETWERPLLDYALRPDWPRLKSTPDPEIVKHLLAIGASPNEIVLNAVSKAEGSSKNTDTTKASKCPYLRENTRRPTVWTLFLASFPIVFSVNRSACLSTLRLMLQHGASQWISMAEILCIFEGQSGHASVSLLASDWGIVAQNLQNHLQRNSDTPTSANPKHTRQEAGYFRVTDILTSMATPSHPHRPLLSEDDLATLK
jgi:NACHT domain